MRNEPTIPYEVLMVVMAVAICISVHTLGLKGIFWVYPGLFIIYFMVARRLALMYSDTIIAVATGLAYDHVGFEVAARVGATLALVLLMINVVINVIGELQDKLVEQAITDPLTGAFNRRHFDTQLRGIVERPADGRAGHALLAIDIDHFKAINDRHGHPVGDQVLIDFSRILRESVREVDRVGRWGGEEFVILMPGTGLEEARQAAERMRLAVAGTPTRLRQTTCGYTSSFGVVEFSAAEAGAAALFQRVDAALYRAKERGRNRVETG
jgi:diguanylate cyclase (GGDEF)-like protein